MKLARWEKITGSFFYVGYITKGPGTVTSLLVFIPAWFAERSVLITALLILLPVTFYLAYRFEKCVGQDPSAFTLDEVIGSLLVIACIPHTLTHFAAFFIIWRLLDIFKPLFKKAEQIPLGIGIVLDDLIAAACTVGISYLYTWLR
mgnify:FL=1|jgi:phosphatidylglycerophosphatase A